MLYIPLKIGDHVTIEDGAVIQAASIGSFVKIGKNAILVQIVFSQFISKGETKRNL